MKIEKIRIKNFKVYQDTEIRDLPNMCVFLGANGAGKSTLFEVFGFLSDALKSNVKTALNKRGGYKEVYSRNGEGDIEIEIKFRNPDIDGKKQPLITYELSVCLGEKNTPVVSKEVLSYRRGNRGRPYRFLEFTYGKGNAIVNESEFETAKQEFKEQREEQTLDSPDILAIKGLGQFQKFNAISSFRRLLENWYVSNFQIQAAQNIEDTGLSEHLSTSGDNLAQVTKYIYENYPETFQKILDKMKERVPGIDKVEATETIDGRIVLQFSDGSFKDPFISRFVSDGTIKMFAYLVLLNDPKPHPLLCIEEPENYLHPELLIELAEEFRDYANRGGQVFISSHSPDFVNALELDELFWLNKDKGFTSIKRASDDEAISTLFDDGDKLGYLWKQGYFIGSGPKN
ncbi:AAA family ATPase [Flavobacterium eburneipallidum]|uniref:AAA family ATPase n=1 Tax=Flavobacterium eburneipallidum TaxID=3003263 RepID=UPI0024823555|nr:AAA family ATPase [Flavobacterium eburneipallidum]